MCRLIRFAAPSSADLPGRTHTSVDSRLQWSLEITGRRSAAHQESGAGDERAFVVHEQLRYIGHLIGCTGSARRAPGKHILVEVSTRPVELIDAGPGLHQQPDHGTGMIGYRLGQVWVFGAGQNERTLDLQGFLKWSQQDSNLCSVRSIIAARPWSGLAARFALTNSGRLPAALPTGETLPSFAPSMCSHLGATGSGSAQAKQKN